LLDVTYLPNRTDKTLDLLAPSSPNYIGPLEPNNAIEVARRLSLNSNLMDVVYDCEDLKLWVAYAEGGDRAANREFVEFDFGSAIKTYTLTLNVVNGDLGYVDVDPNQPEYEPDQPVTLTAVPDPDSRFSHWRIYDPNTPGDPNYAKDGNNPITLSMTADREVTAVFKCGGGAAHGLPLAALGLVLLRLTARRLRRWG
jgi:hypothetical protein